MGEVDGGGVGLEGRDEMGRFEWVGDSLRFPFRTALLVLTREGPAEVDDCSDGLE
jgi:hypothetical protein